MRRQRGFTLIEIMVAIAIIGIGVAALVSSVGASASRADHLRQREFGRWVASNLLVQLQVENSWPDNGTVNTESDFAGMKWYLRSRTQAVEDPDLKRVDIEARLNRDSDGAIYTVTGFLGNPELRWSEGGLQEGSTQ